MGLRYDEHLASQLLEGVMGMEESVTYQAIVAKGLAAGRAQGHAEGRAEGRAEGQVEGARQEARKLLLRQGAEAFGAPAPTWVAETLGQMDNLEHLEALATKLLRVESWEELLPRKSSRRKKGST